MLNLNRAAAHFAPDPKSAVADFGIKDAQIGNTRFEMGEGSAAGQHHIGGFVQQRAKPPVAALGDAACIVDLTGLITTRDQAQIGASIARTSEAIGVVDLGYER